MSTCFAQSWIWAKSANSSPGTTEGYDVASDVSGNVYVTGNFSSHTITFGTISLINAGTGENIFLTKYDASGNVIWATSAPGNGHDNGFKVCVDPSSNDVFLTGSFSSSSITFGSTVLTNSGGNDFFLARYNAATGNAMWAVSATGSTSDIGHSVTADGLGNVYVTGNFSSASLNFGPSVTNVISSGFSEDIFLAKYTTAGAIVWAKSMGGTTNDEGRGVSADPSGNVFVTGYFTSPSINLGTTTLTNVDPSGFSEDLFIAKYNAAGNVLWARSVGGNGQKPDISYGVCSDPSGNAFAVGSFTSPTIAFGSYTLTVTSAGNSDAFITKYDANGNVLWAQSASGAAADKAYNVATDASGNAYTVGAFSIFAGPASITFGSYNLPFPAGGIDPLFIAKYDPNGTVLCASALACGGDDQNGVATDGAGNAYIGSDFELNPFTVGGTTLNRTSTEDIFVAKYTCGNSILTENTTHTDALCSGQCNGTVKAMPAGGSPPYTYLWSPGGETVAAVSGLCAGNYTVAVKDAAGATITSTVSVTEPAVLTSSVISTQSSCSGSSNGAVTIAASGGTGAFTYSWAPGGQTTPGITGLVAGDYTATITDANGCTRIQTADVLSSGTFTLSATAIGTTCGKNNGSALVNVTGSASPYTYSWSPAGESTSAISGLSPGTYTTVVMDAAGCAQTQTVNIATSLQGPVANTTGDTTILSGQSTVITASGGGTYSWNNGATDAAITVAPSATTVYCVTITDANNCTDTACAKVVVDSIYCSADLYLPNAFSPNGDGENDTLEIYSRNIACIKFFELVIYDRWGEKIFETGDPHFRWNGEYEGKMQNTAVFNYSLHAILISGKEINKKGNIILMR